MHFKHSLLSLNGNNVFKAVLKKKKKKNSELESFLPPKLTKLLLCSTLSPYPTFYPKEKGKKSFEGAHLIPKT